MTNISNSIEISFSYVMNCSLCLLFSTHILTKKLIKQMINMNILQQFLSIQLIFMLLFNVLFHFLNIKNLSVSFHPSNINVYVNKEIQKENKANTQQQQQAKENCIATINNMNILAQYRRNK